MRESEEIRNRKTEEQERQRNESDKAVRETKEIERQRSERDRVAREK